MRHRLIRTVPAALAFLLSACGSGDAVGPDPLEPVFSRGAVVHSVTGSGFVAVMPGFSFRHTIAAHLDARGYAFGSVTVNMMDVSAFGIAGPVTVVQDVRCMVVDGNTAWIGTRIVHTTNPALGAPGGLGVAWVVDLGGPGEDITYGGPSEFWDPDDRICSGTPPMLPPTLATGNFHVR